MVSQEGVMQNDMEVAKELLVALKEDTSKVSGLESDKLYSLQMGSGKELIANSTFESLDLNSKLVTGMYSLGFEKPTLIQNLAIPQIIKGKDAAFQGKSGTGKTMAFALGALEKTVSGAGPQVLILSPTRELCMQITAIVRKLAAFGNLNVCAALSDFNKSTITEEIIVGTPGKVVSLVNNSIIVPETLKIIIFDEADDLISNQAFTAITIKLLKKFEKAQKIFVSATYSELSQKALAKLAPSADRFLDKNVKADKIELYYIEVDKNKKIDALKDLFSYLTIAQCIIFVATRVSANFVSNHLKQDGFSISTIHGELKPEVRDAVFQDFLKASTKVLVATNVFSRGMDIPQVNLIINYDIPNFATGEDQQTYIHRIGRSGRFNRSGFVIDFVSSKEDLALLGGIQSGIGSVSKKFTLDALKNAFINEDDPL
ncbi:RNA helicase [Glugoides intestinalis]